MSIDYQLDGGVGTVLINRPERMNAIDFEMQRQLLEVWSEIENDDRVRVVVLTGAGDRAFCAGDDMRSSAGKTGLDYWLDMRPDGFGHLPLRKTLNVPVLGRINGFALGGGMELVIGCDLAIASDTAEFGFVEPRLGRLPLDGGIVSLARQLPAKWAMEVLLTGRRFNAIEAKQLALVNEVVPQEDLDSATDRWVEQLLACAPLSLRAIKEMVKKGEGMKAAEARQMRFPDLIRCLESEDGDEGVQAFLDHRAPVWSGR